MQDYLMHSNRAATTRKELLLRMKEKADKKTRKPLSASTRFPSMQQLQNLSTSQTPDK